ncbi:MAG: class II fructose-bisphosphate aldolase [Oligosphaeraceae bacterium]|nr:class II fructose-bisphosphate aldolase [Oligosphaeraceae bacterium]
MALRRMDELLKDARRKRCAVGAFECWNSDNVHAIAIAAARADAPVIFQASPAEYETMGGADVLRRMVEGYVEKYHLTAALHLDHGSTLEHVQECLEAGFTSVMLDASALPFEENCELSRKTAELAHARGVSVEAELGHVGGTAEGGIIAESSLTIPSEAVRFVEQSGIDCLAVAIGTIHGDYRGEPRLRLDLLQEIAQSLPGIPLVLHGGSGTPHVQLMQAIRLGISKINICTEIHKTYLKAIDEARGHLTPSVPGKFYQPVVEAVSRHVERLICQFRGENAT